MKKKLNYKKLGVFALIIIVVVVLLIIIISNLVKQSKYHKTYEYKLSEVGYTENEVDIILKKLSDKQIDDVLKSDYQVELTKFLKEKYFIFKNLAKYLDYSKSNKNIDTSKVVSIVNVGADSDWYENILKTDTSKGKLMLVNKFYQLDEGYEPEDLTEISQYYAYDGMYASKVLIEDLSAMLDAARAQGYTLVVSQGYRSYKDQEDTYKSIEDINGTNYADSVAARAGHSEYQTGLSLSIEPYGKVVEDVNMSPEHKWLINNCYKYGFILRFPENTKSITGFESDDWRFRYVGVDASSKIHNENITFDEYYAYYINK